MENQVASVNSALQLLNLIAERPDLGLSGLARAAGITKSRAFRLLCTLEQQFYVQRIGEPAVYRLGPQALVLGNSARAQNSLVALAEPQLDALSAAHDENLQLRIREGDEAVQILARASKQTLQVRSQVGNRRKLGAGASGELLLAKAPPEIQQQFMQQSEDPTALQQKLLAIDRQQFAVTRGALTPGVWAIAVPLYDGSARCIAALSLSAPAARAEQNLAAYLFSLRQAAYQISRQLGCPEQLLSSCFIAPSDEVQP